MKLSLKEACVLLGKNPRQVRYLISQNKIDAHKVAGRWLIDSETLPLSEGQKRANIRKAKELSGTIDKALGPYLGEDQHKRYSVRQMVAFQVGVPLRRESLTAFGEAHAVTQALEQVLIEVTRGCHRYHHSEKLEAYRQARSHASTAVARLFIEGSDEAVALASKLEGELLPAISGLLKRSEGRRARR